MDDIELWDKIHAARQWGTCPEPAVARWAMRRWGGQLKDAMGQVRLLEVGCGTGAMAFWLGEHGFLVDATDASPHAIERARHMNLLPHSVRLHEAILPFGIAVKDGHYDGVLDVCCLQHVDNITGAIKDIARVLKPGGELLSIFASDRHTPFLLGDEMHGTTFHRFSMTEAYEVFGVGEFATIRMEQMWHTDNSRMVSHWVIQATKGES